MLAHRLPDLALVAAFPACVLLGVGSPLEVAAWGVAGYVAASYLQPFFDRRGPAPAGRLGAVVERVRDVSPHPLHVVTARLAPEDGAACASGWGPHGTILVAPERLAGLDDDAVEAILLHELGHLASRDNLHSALRKAALLTFAGWLAAFVARVLFAPQLPSPDDALLASLGLLTPRLLFWHWAERRRAELDADQFALARGADPKALEKALLSARSQRFGWALLLATIGKEPRVAERLRHLARGG